MQLALVEPMVRSVEPTVQQLEVVEYRALDEESRRWLDELRADGATKEAAVARLHAVLLRAARFEVARRRPKLPHLRGNELDDISLEAADDALMSVLRRLDDFRGASRFTTWATSRNPRGGRAASKRAGMGAMCVTSRRLVLSRCAGLAAVPARSSELLATLHARYGGVTPHQRRVLVRLALNCVRSTCSRSARHDRGALYKRPRRAAQLRRQWTMWPLCWSS